MPSESSIKERPPTSVTQALGHPDLYKTIFTHSSEPIAIISLEGFYLEQNSAHALLLGYSDDELANQTPAIHLGEAAFSEIAFELARTGEYRGETVSKTKTGEERFIELTAFAMRDDEGNPVCYVGIKRDITSRKQAEAALQRSEADLNDFFENAEVGLHWVGPDGTILRANRAELEMLGYDAEEYVGRNISEFYIDPHVIEEILGKLRAGEVLQEYEARLRCKDGNIKVVRIDSNVYREDGKFVHTRCFTSDITERKRTESRLALQYAVTQILAQSHDFVESAS